jgi:LmbE family N-acetylglucosaminyl deacetylase
MTHEKLASIRREEQLAAGKELGLKDVFFLDHTDTQLVSDLYLKEQIVRIIRTVRPHTVITMDPTFYFYSGPEFSFINHTDHRAVSLATLDAVFPLCRDRLTFPEHEKEGLAPHKVPELLLVNFTTPNHVVDISSVWDKKVEILKHHTSQFSDVNGFIKVMKQRSDFFAKGTGYTYAENFTRLLIP